MYTIGIRGIKNMEDTALLTIMVQVSLAIVAFLGLCSMIRTELSGKGIFASFFQSRLTDYDDMPREENDK